MIPLFKRPRSPGTGSLKKPTKAQKKAPLSQCGWVPVVGRCSEVSSSDNANDTRSSTSTVGKVDLTHMLHEFGCPVVGRQSGLDATCCMSLVVQLSMSPYLIGAGLRPWDGISPTPTAIVAWARRISDA